PVLYTTGYARNAIVHGGRLDPGLHLITKPFTRQALAAKLRQVLDGAALAHPVRLLLVEDEVLVRMVAMDVLREAGFEVDEAAAAAEALARMAEDGSGFAAAILDFGLPDRTADGLAVDLRALHADLPLVIASGYDESEMRHRFTGQGRIAFVTKPYESFALGNALRTLGIAVSSRPSP
ncbi:MAG: response regulator, partial [Geminicoccaceae bacterium]